MTVLLNASTVGNTGLVITSDSSGAIQFQSNGTTNTVFIAANSYVGIGTTSPAGFLDVTNRGITTGSMPAGSIIQVAQGTQNSTVSFTSVTTGTEYDPSLSVSITPTKSTSKIMILINLQVWMQSSSSTWYGHSRIYRSGTKVYEGGNAQIVGGNAVVEYGGQWTMLYIDSPATTSSTTYAVKWVHDGNGTMNNLYFHRNNNPDSIIAMEIAQ
jgi:hypothetical protein